MLNGEDGLKKMMLQPAYGGEGEEATSQAQLVADMINIMRLDVAELGDAMGVDIEASYMTAERAAELLQRLVRGESLELIEVFNDIEEKRERLLEEAADKETLYSHRETKDSVTQVATEYDFGPTADEEVPVPEESVEDVLDDESADETEGSADA